MKKEGEVNYCYVDRDVGYVEYVHYDDMKSALRRLDDTKLVCGQESSYIRVYRARSRSPSYHRRSRNDSRSPARNDSRSPARNDSRSPARRDSMNQKDSRSPSRDSHSSRDSRSPDRRDD